MEFVTFSFYKIVEKLDKKGIAKKELKGMIEWEKITKTQINPNHTAHALICGKMSGVTVFDFDIEEVYFDFVKMFPDLKKYKTIKTKNGFHVYCLYDEDIKTTTDGFVNHKGVDIRNDKSIVFCPPCQRHCLDGSVFVYEDLGGEILPVPEIFLDNMKQLEDTPETVSETNSIETVPLYSSKDVKYIDDAITNGWLNDMATASWDEWRNVGFAIKHTLGEEGKDFFHKFSKINVDKYDENYTNGFWKGIKQSGKPLTIGSIKFWVKQYKEKHEKKETEEDIEFIENDDEAGELFLKKLKGMIVYCGGQVFMKVGNVWRLDDVDSYILNFILTSDVKKKVAEGKFMKYSKNLSDANRAMTVLLAKLKTKHFDIYDKFHTTTRNRICFRDGVLDFNTKKFYTWDEIDFEYYTCVMIERDFLPYFQNPNETIIRKIKTEVLDNLFNDDVENACRFLSRGITANIEDKLWATYLGNRNCGKGILYNLLSSGFGTYVKPFELSNILIQRNTNVDEVSRKLYWTLDLQFARIAISQETPPPSSNLKIDGKMIKKLAGGGDSIVARRNFDRKDTHFKIDTTFFMMGNNYLPVSIQDANEKRLEFGSVISFQDSEGENTKKKDPLLKELSISQEYGNAMVMIMLDYWRDTPVEIVMDEEEKEETLRGQILNIYELSKGDYVLVNDIGFEDVKKVALELKSMGVTKKKLKTKKDRDRWCFYGLKKRENVVESENA